MKTNDIEFKISKYNGDGRGVAFFGGGRRIIDGVLRDETVKIDGRGGVEIVKPSPFRIAPACAVFSKCGGCNLLFAEYEEQLRIKKAALAECLKDLGGDIPIADTVGMYYPFKYRNKIHLAFSETPNGRVKIGFFEENSKRVTDFKECLLHDKSAEILKEILKNFVAKYRLKIYGNSQEGLRYAAARFLDGGVMLTVVSTYAALPNADELFGELSKHFKDVSLYLNVNRLENSMVFSDKFIHLAGKTSLTGKLCGVKFDYYPSAFLQINDRMAAKVYNDVLNAADIDGETTVLDIFSGIGVTSVLFAKKCAKVYSVELSKEAVKAAVSLKKTCGLPDKIINICGDAGAELTRLSLDIDDGKQEVKAINTIRSKNSAFAKPTGNETKNTKNLNENANSAFKKPAGNENENANSAFEKPALRTGEIFVREYENPENDKNNETEYLTANPINKNLLVFADPPRTGLGEKVIRGILRLNPKQIVYLSCNPKTLGEDLKKLTQNYSVKSVTPYDMFPQTRHVETLVILDGNKK
ncbi:MAG: hypothetical protein LBP62_08395 [Clostridiales bacterium]|jgi:23S rRNA (uracil1939-C5)-methyltransferase|nr:hypothetical protein [Clostridiales bacterium]